MILRLILVLIIITFVLMKIIEHFMCCKDKIKVCANRGYASKGRCHNCCEKFANIEQYKQCMELCYST
jgi:hypothetical protein